MAGGQRSHSPLLVPELQFHLHCTRKITEYCDLPATKYRREQTLDQHTSLNLLSIPDLIVFYI